MSKIELNITAANVPQNIREMIHAAAKASAFELTELVEHGMAMPDEWVYLKPIIDFRADKDDVPFAFLAMVGEDDDAYHTQFGHPVDDLEGFIRGVSAELAVVYHDAIAGVTEEPVPHDRGLFPEEHPDRDAIELGFEWAAARLAAHAADREAAEADVTEQLIASVEDNVEINGVAWTEWNGAGHIVDAYDEGEPGDRGREILDAAIAGGDARELLEAWRAEINV